MTCHQRITPELACSDPAEVLLDRRPLCAGHLHELHPNAVESGHADRIPGLVFLD